MIFTRNYMNADIERRITVGVGTSVSGAIYVFPDGTQHVCEDRECPEVDEIATGMLTPEPITSFDVLREAD